MVARPCRATNCANLVKSPAQRGYCDAHAEMRGAFARGKESGSTTKRGYGSAWQRLRKQVLERDGFICQCADCKASGRLREASEVDHIVGKADGGTDATSNLQAINRDCHRKKTARESK